MAVKHPYYIDNEYQKSLNLTTKEIEAIKYNNIFLTTIFTRLVGSKGNVRQSINNDDLTRFIMNNTLPREKDVDPNKFSYNDLGGKINFLLTQIENNPQDKEFFNQSYFSSLIGMIRSGSTQTQALTEPWHNYKHTEKAIPSLKKLSALNAALACYAQDRTTPIGLNFAAIIDCLIQKDNNGKYRFVRDFSPLKNASEGSEMFKAVDRQLVSFKSNQIFKRNFEVPQPASEDEIFSDL
ncbi:MAG: hypothetical protein J6K97_03545 [Clostridia bacterium]|nr:hypothetical protein [Clostridia bacterium]